jgi:hypothetical protein
MPSATPDLASLILGAGGGLILALTLYAARLQLERTRLRSGRTHPEVDASSARSAGNDDPRRLLLVLMGFFLVVACSLALSPIPPDLYWLFTTFAGTLIVVPQVVSLAVPTSESGKSRGDSAAPDRSARRNL